MKRATPAPRTRSHRAPTDVTRPLTVDDRLHAQRAAELDARAAAAALGHDLHAFTTTEPADHPWNRRAVCRSCGSWVRVRAFVDGSIERTGAAIEGRCRRG